MSLRVTGGSILYNKKIGFVFFPSGVVENGPSVLIGPAYKRTIDVSFEEIGKIILECLVISKNSIPLDRHDVDRKLAIRETGLKSDAQVYKQCEYLEFTQRGDLLEITDARDFKINVKSNDINEIGRVISEWADGFNKN